MLTHITDCHDLTIDGLKKVWITHVSPEIDGGQFPVKRIINDTVTVEADIFTDGIDAISATLSFKHEHDAQWQQVALTAIGNDRMQASFQVTKLGNYSYTLRAWVNDFQTWKARFVKKLTLLSEPTFDTARNYDLALEAITGANLIKQTQQHHAPAIIQHALKLLSTSVSVTKLLDVLADDALNTWMTQALLPNYITHYPHELNITVDRPRARFNAWYELFPRSFSQQPGRHGTFNDVTAYLSHIKEMGFDVIYFPPIHPIGLKNRKGRNNSTTAEIDEPGSPWAIGNSDGGHQAVHAQLGTLDDFRQLLKLASDLDIDIALDFALQCSPDHPYLTQHPEWFKQRPDGSLHYAENPPKKYQDIYPFDFASSAWPEMWQEFKAIVLFWINEGVTVFRVDNPHTKPFIFWQWLITEIKQTYPHVLFLSEAFTRPNVMYQLAKGGFSQSYTYFSWRNTKQELTDYMTELNSAPLRDFFRPHLWCNTPDILSSYLQEGGRGAFIIRFILAATLSSSYGIYGPAYEYCLNMPLHAGSEEYLDSEKYELKQWAAQAIPSANIIDVITTINKIRREHEALQNNTSLVFHETDNPEIICYSKHNNDASDVMLMVVNLNYQHKQSAFVTIDLTLPVTADCFLVHDVLTNDTYQWQRGRCYVELNPSKQQYAHMFHVKHSELV